MQSVYNTDVRPRFSDVIDELKLRFSRQAGSRAGSIRDAAISGTYNLMSPTIGQNYARKTSNTRANAQSSNGTSEIALFASMSPLPGESSKRGYQQNQDVPPSPPQSPQGFPKEEETRTISSRFLFELVRRSSVGEDTGLNDLSWTNFSMSQSEHEQFQGKIKGGSEEEQTVGSFFESTFRYDWEPEAGTLSVRKPTPLHEIFLRSVIGEILKQIKAFSEKDEAVSKVLDNIKDRGSLSVILEPPPSSPLDLVTTSKPITRSPDGSLSYQGSTSRYPVAVFEVSCPKKRKDLPYVADSYIVDSQHDIRTVIGLDIESSRSPRRSSYGDLIHSATLEQKRDKSVNKLATISYWTSFQDIDENGDRVGSSQCLLEHEPFRSPSGLSLPGHFRISICALLPDEVVTTIPFGHALRSLYVNISFARLSEMLEEAEGMQEVIQKRKSADIPNPKPKKWLKRKRPSPELPCPEVEANCRGGGEG